MSTEIVQLGEHKTEDLKVPGSKPGFGTDPLPEADIFHAACEEWVRLL